ncbi:MAG: hypothetical protein AAB345_01355 [Patescibacteria group bacterium]
MSDQCKCGVKEGSCLIIVIPMMLVICMINSCTTDENLEKLRGKSYNTHAADNSDIGQLKGSLRELKDDVDKKAAKRDDLERLEKKVDRLEELLREDLKLRQKAQAEEEK